MPLKYVVIAYPSNFFILKNFTLERMVQWILEDNEPFTWVYQQNFPDLTPTAPTISDQLKWVADIMFLLHLQIL